MNFVVSGDAYDRFMGRYSRPLAPAFADFAGIPSDGRVLDVGCGSGVLTEELARRVGADHVSGVDPSPLLAACAERVPNAELKQGWAEALPWPDDSFEAAIAQLVIHFMEDPAAGVGEMARVTRPGGVVAGCSWDFSGGMEMLRVYWETARELDHELAGEYRSFGKLEELDALWHELGLEEVEAGPIEVSSEYGSFDELWDTFLLGVGPAGQYIVALPPDRQATLKDAYRERLGVGDGAFTLGARAWAARGRVPA
ncbi:MAG TPA: class I SAM-dependent methyltransferase [Gaiellaceae bacterium]|nr:class I SAM-dependent methyltransferase [Gaiellaceae bacterium]